MKELYNSLKYNGKVMDIIDYDPEILHVFSRDVLKKIINWRRWLWKSMLPEGNCGNNKRKKLLSVTN